MTIKFALSAEQRAENVRKMKETRARKLMDHYGAMLLRYRTGGMTGLTNREAGKLLGVSASTVSRMLQWAGAGKREGRPRKQRMEEMTA